MLFCGSKELHKLNVVIPKFFSLNPQEIGEWIHIIFFFQSDPCVCVYQLGAELGALAISHLEEVTDEGIAAMATARTAAVLLPTTAYILRYFNSHTRILCPVSGE